MIMTLPWLCGYESSVLWVQVAVVCWLSIGTVMRWRIAGGMREDRKKGQVCEMEKGLWYKRRGRRWEERGVNSRR